MKLFRVKTKPGLPVSSLSRKATSLGRSLGGNILVFLDADPSSSSVTPSAGIPVEFAYVIQ